MSQTSEGAVLTTRGLRRKKRTIKCSGSLNLIVPGSYRHASSLDEVRNFISFSNTRVRIRDTHADFRHSNFSNPQHTFEPGRSLNVRFYSISHGREVRPEDCHAHWVSHGSMFSEAQTLVLLLHCLVDGQMNLADLPRGIGLVPPSERFSPGSHAHEAAYMYIGEDNACDLRLLDPRVPLHEDRVLIVVESLLRRK